MTKRAASPKPGLKRRQKSRAQREADIQRAVLIGTGVIAAVVVGLLAYAVINELVLKPSRPVATASGKRLSITEFQERVKFDYYRQTGGIPPEQLGVGAEFFAQQTLDGWVEDIVLDQKAAELGIEVTDLDAQEELELAFGFDSGDPEPTPTLAPPTPAPGEPTATPTFVFTLTPSPTPTLEPGVTPSPTATPSPTPSGTLTPTPTSPPLPTPEPLTEDEFTTRYDEFLQDMNAATGISTERLRELWLDTFRTVRLRRLVMEELGITADETKELVRAAHILVLTEEEAQAALERINAGEEFEVVAAEISRDVSNAYRGGDLGWFGRGAMVEPFEEAAFTLSPGEISQPVETSFGWHIIKLYERHDDAIVTPAEQNQQMQTLFAEMLSEWRNEVDVVIADNWLDHVPTLP